MCKQNLILSFLFQILIATKVFALPQIPSLKECKDPITVHISESDSLMSPETFLALRSLVENKGHRVTTSQDLERSQNTLKDYSYVYRRDAALSLAIYSPEASVLRFPMSLAAFKETHVYENMNFPIIKQDVLDRIFAELNRMDRRRLIGTITEEEKNRTIASFFTEDIFVDDAELAGLTATYVMAFSPHQVVPKFENYFWLQSGFGNEEQIRVVGTTVSAVEAKHRVQKALVYYNVTIGELGRIHEVSDLPGLLSRMISPVESGNLLSSGEVESYYLQMISELPQCR